MNTYQTSALTTSNSINEDFLTDNNTKTSKRKRIPKQHVEKVMTSYSHNLTPIDLGLPSGTKWAPCNVGAISIEDDGDFYAFGETKTKEVFSLQNHSFYKDEFLLRLRDNKQSQKGVIHIGFTPYDAATMSIGLWKIPSRDQFIELIENCRFEYFINGAWCTSLKNGEKIFFPACGYKSHHNEEIFHYDYISDCDVFLPHGYYWTDTMVIDESGTTATYFNFGHRNIDLEDANLCPNVIETRNIEYGFLIRPVLCD